MKILVLSNFTGSLLGVRAPLMQAMMDAGHMVVACAPDDAPGVRERFEALGVSYETVPLQRYAMNPVGDLRLLFALAELFRKQQPDRLFGYTIKPVIYGSIAARMAGMAREQVFSMITGLGFAFTAKSLTQRLLSRAVQELYRLALSHNNGVFFHNPDDRDLFTNLGILRPPTRGLIMHGSGVDLVEYAEHPPVIDPLTFLLAARLLKGKGIEEFVQAATALKVRYPSVHFRVLGQDASGPQVIPPGRVRRWRAAGFVEFDTVTDVRPELARASVFVLPSYREGTPRAILEALAMGCPIVTTDAPGCRETVRHGQNGFLVPVGDSAALERTMERFIHDRDLIPRMGRCSRAIAVDKYDVKKVVACALDEMGLS